MTLLCLLIVPYGIETSANQPSYRTKHRLLIVPYGIETYQSVSQRFHDVHLLIVPYGIETAYGDYQVCVRLCPFNRTLWN